MLDPYETETPMLIGYARTSTLDQTAGFEAQLGELAQAGCEKVFSEQVSSVAPRAQLEGIAKAKGEGKYKGRAPTAQAKAAEARALRKEGVGATEIAKRLGIGRASVYRVLTTAGP